MTFKYLNLETDNDSYRYVPFTQACMLETRYESFEGACGELSDEWLLKRTDNFNADESPVYGRGQANNPYLPHPVVNDEL